MKSNNNNNNIIVNNISSTKHKNSYSNLNRKITDFQNNNDINNGFNFKNNNIIKNVSKREASNKILSAVNNIKYLSSFVENSNINNQYNKYGNSNNESSKNVVNYNQVFNNTNNYMFNNGLFRKESDNALSINKNINNNLNIINNNKSSKFMSNVNIKTFNDEKDIIQKDGYKLDVKKDLNNVEDTNNNCNIKYKFNASPNKSNLKNNMQSLNTNDDLDIVKYLTPCNNKSNKKIIFNVDKTNNNINNININNNIKKTDYNKSITISSENSNNSDVSDNIFNTEDDMTKLNSKKRINNIIKKAYVSKGNKNSSISTDNKKLLLDKSSKCSSVLKTNHVEDKNTNYNISNNISFKNANKNYNNNISPIKQKYYIQETNNTVYSNINEVVEENNKDNDNLKNNNYSKSRTVRIKTDDQGNKRNEIELNNNNNKKSNFSDKNVVDNKIYIAESINDYTDKSDITCLKEHSNNLNDKNENNIIANLKISSNLNKSNKHTPVAYKYNQDYKELDNYNTNENIKSNEINNVITNNQNSSINALNNNMFGLSNNPSSKIKLKQKNSTTMKLLDYKQSIINNIKNNSFINNAMITGNINYENIANLQIDNSEYLKEIKELKTEINMYKNYIQAINDKLENEQKLKLEIEHLYKYYEENNKKIFKCEIDNINKCFEVYRKFYEEELLSRKNIIENLSVTIEDLLLK